jgi:hypothetical protein
MITHDLKTNFEVKKYFFDKNFIFKFLTKAHFA